MALSKFLYFLSEVFLFLIPSFFISYVQVFLFYFLSALGRRLHRHQEEEQAAACRDITVQKNRVHETGSLRPEWTRGIEAASELGGESECKEKVVSMMPKIFT